MAILDIASKGIGLLGNAAGAAKQVASLFKNQDKENAKEDARQLTQQKKLQDIGIEGSKEMTDYQKMKELEQWKATGYVGQKEQLEKAGLNAGLLYGMGGSGGSTTGGGAVNVGSGSAADAASSSQANTAAQRQQMDIAMQMAQMENLKANTEKTKAEATNIAPEGIQGKNTIADTAVKEATAEIQKIAARVANETEDSAARQIIMAANEQAEKAREQFNKAQIAEETQRDEINRIKSEALGAAIQNMATKQGMKLSEAQITNMKESIKLGWKELEQGAQKIATEHGDNQSGIAASERNTEKMANAILGSAGIGAAGHASKNVKDWIEALKKKPSIGFKIK